MTSAKTKRPGDTSSYLWLKYSTVEYITVQDSTVQYITVQDRTGQYSTLQYSSTSVLIVVQQFPLDFASSFFSSFSSRAIKIAELCVKQ